MGWTVLNWIMGIICIVGPLLLIVWYVRALRVQISKLKEGQGPEK